MNRDIELLKNYGQTSNEECRKLAKRIIPVKSISNSLYPYQNAVDQRSPRSKAFNMQGYITNKIEKPFKKIDEIEIYNKSMSNMVLKIDIGEVFDQMTDDQKVETKYFSLRENTYRAPILGDGKVHDSHFIVSIELWG